MKPSTPHFLCRSLAAALLYVVILLGGVQGRAATGDLYPICFNSDLTDSFALIALANIPGGTRYFIADNAWSTAAGTLIQEGASPSPSRQIQFDVAAGGIPFGTVIKFDQSGANVVLTDPSLGTLTMVARFPVEPAPGTTKLSLTIAGDQLLIYQTAGGTPGGTVTMVSALNVSVVSNPANGLTISNGWQVGTLPQAGQTAATSECNAPGGLVVYDGLNASTATALGIGSFPVSGGLTGQDNYKYNGPFFLADKTAYLTAINNPANWVANDTTEYDLSSVGPGPGAPEINVQGNGANIADGSVTPQGIDHTLFGSAPVTGGTIARTFTIQNIGTSNLVISAGGITFSGANAGEFSLSGITLPATISPNASSNFVVTFDPAAAGARTATVNIANNDSNENPYNFNIQGYGFNYIPPAGTPPTLKWSTNIQNSNVGSTRAVGSTTSGDIIAATKINAGTAGNIRVTRHNSTTGAITWTRDFDSGNSDDVNDMLVDPANGDTYIAARATVNTTNLNWFVHKVNGDGSLGWTYTYDSPNSLNDECFALTRTSDGNVVAVGMTTTASGSFARAARINAATGAELNAYISPVNFSDFRGVAADGSGNVYVTGGINDINANGLTLKLNSTLGLVWTQTFDGAAALFDGFAHVAVHPSSGDCVVGGTTRTSSTNLDVIVIRYGAAAPGTEVWRRVIAGTAVGSESINNLVVDGNGDLYAAGAIRNVSSSDRDAFVSKITGSSGALAWITNRLGSAADSSDRFQNVRVSGNSVYAVGNLDNATRDIVVSRFNGGTGAEEWTFTFNGSGNGADDVFSGKSVMTLLGTDSLALGGETLDVSGNTFGIVRKYSAFVPPVVTTVGASNITATTATLHATVNPGGDSAGYYFQYGLTTSYGSRTSTNALASGSAAVPVNAAVTGLTPNTLYHFRIVATNNSGSATGLNLTFTTVPFAIAQQPANSGACVGSTATFTVAANAPSIATYQWQRSNPGALSFVNIANATNASYTTPATTLADDGAVFRVLVSGGGANLTSSSSFLSVIGVSSPTVTYDFNAGLPPNTAVYGSSFVSGGLLELNPNAMSQSGAFLMPDLAPGRLVRGFAATFKVRMIRGGSENGDGFSFNWATDLPNNVYVTGEEGEGSGLRVCFDTYNNGASEAPAIDVKWGTNVVGHYLTSNAFLPGAANDFAEVSIRLNTNGTLDLTYRCTPIFSGLVVTNYSPLINARFGLGSRAGAAFESHSIDDLAIQLFLDSTIGVPHITSVKTNGSGGLTITGTGSPGATLALNATTNLSTPANWGFRATVVPNGSGVFTFNEPNISTPTNRFYRVASALQLPANLVTWWRAESNYLDSFGGVNGTPINNLGFASGQRGLAFNFDGTNHAMNSSGTAIPVPWTACFWVKRQDAAGASAVLISDATSGLKLEQASAARRVGFTLFGSADYSFNYMVPTNTWTHLAFVAAPGSTILYTNGVATGTNAATVALPRATLGALLNGSGDKLKGQLDETTLFNRALTPAEIQQVLNATRGP